MKTVRRDSHNEPTGGRKADMKKRFLDVSFLTVTALLSLVIAGLHLSGCRDKDTKLSNVHSNIVVYEGAKTCDECHPGVIADVRASTHYKFLSELPDNYVYENAAAATPVTATQAGKMTKI
jgi:hypothetical protein